MKKLIFCLLPITIFLISCSKQKFMDTFSQKQHYDFRKVRWGMSQAQVELSESDNIMAWRTTTEIIYNVKVSNIPCKVIYTFKNNRLRTAGYITPIPKKNVDNIIEKCIAKHAHPTTVYGGKTWEGSHSVVHSRSYASFYSIVQTKYRHRSGGALGLGLPSPVSTTTRSNATFMYIDTQFWNEIHAAKLPLNNLSFYEQHLLGITESTYGRFR